MKKREIVRRLPSYYILNNNIKNFNDQRRMKMVQDDTNGEYYMAGVETQDVDDSLFT